MGRGLQTSTVIRSIIFLPNQQKSCNHVVSSEMTSCLADVFANRTSGSGENAGGGGVVDPTLIEMSLGLGIGGAPHRLGGGEGGRNRWVFRNGVSSRPVDYKTILLEPTQALHLHNWT
jgi:hypothetical protein